MKKILIILSCFLLAGCQYKDLAKISIVSMISIEYNEKFIVTTFNIVPDKDNTRITLIESSDSDLFEALNKNIMQSTSEPYYNHITTILIDSYMLGNLNLLNNLIKEYDIPTNFSIVYSDDINSINEFYKNEEPIHTLATTINNLEGTNLYFQDYLNNKNLKIPTFIYDNKPLFIGYTSIKKKH